MKSVSEDVENVLDDVESVGCIVKSVFDGVCQMMWKVCRMECV